MRKTKKVVAFFLSVLMILSICPVAVFAADSSTPSVELSYEMESDNVLIVTVALRNAKGLESSDLSFHYDSSVLEFISFQRLNGAEYCVGGSPKAGSLTTTFFWWLENSSDYTQICQYTLKVLMKQETTVSTSVDTWENAASPITEPLTISLDKENNNPSANSSVELSYMLAPDNCIILTVSLRNAQGLGSSDLEFNYDSSVLDYVSFKNLHGADFCGGGSPEDGSLTASFFWLPRENSSDYVQICQYTLRVLTKQETTVSTKVDTWENVVRPITEALVISLDKPCSHIDSDNNGVCDICGEQINEEVHKEIELDENSDLSVIETYVKSVPGLCAGEIQGQLMNDYVKIVDGNGNDVSTEVTVGTGNRIQVLDKNGNILSEYEVLIPMDVDGNAKITAADARLALRQSAKLEKLAGVFEQACDADGKKGITAADARKILRVSAKLEPYA